MVLFMSLLLAHICIGQTNSQPFTYPSHLQYTFSNFVWWSNDDLRALLKKRIPGLGDEIAPTLTEESKVRNELKVLLKERGVVAEIQSEEPSNFALTAERAPGAPDPAIVFRILSPQIVVSKVVLSDLPDSVGDDLNDKFHRWEGHPYAGSQDWQVRNGIQNELASKGYLESEVDIIHDEPIKDGDHYSVNLLVSVKAGSQYHIASLTADGGPLLMGRDLCPHFTEKVGDLAERDPFERLSGELRGLYWQHGYAEVKFNSVPTLDRDKSLVSYHLEVVSGPVYHLRNITITHLDPIQEEKVKQLLGLKSGDIFDQMAVHQLYHKLATETSLSTYGFGFSPQLDRTSATADLTLNFYKTSDKSSVTTH